MLGNAGNDVSQVGLGIETVQFAGRNKRIDCGAAFTTTVGAEVEEVFPAESNSSQCTLRRIIVNLDAAIVDIQR